MAGNKGGLSRQQRRALQRAQLAELERQRQTTPALPSWHVRIRSSIRLVLGSPIVAIIIGLVATLVTAAFSVAGIITMFLTHIFLILAFVVSGAGLGALEWFWFSKFGAILLSVSLIMVGLFLFAIDQFIENNRPEDPYSGIISAGSDPMIVGNTCADQHQDAPFIAYVGSVTSVISQFPKTLVEIKGKDIIRIERSNDGNIEIYLDIFDMNNKVIATIENNKFDLNQNNIFKKERPNKSSLIIYDQYKNKVLDIHYRNKREVSIAGALYYHAGVSFVENALIFPGGGNINLPDGLCLVGTLNIN